MTVSILRADARALPLADQSVDLIVTSPPYYGQRAYEDQGEAYTGQLGDEDHPTQFIAELVACTREWMRVLKPSGSIFVNLGDSYYSGKGAPTQPDPKNAARRLGLRPLDRSGLGYPRKSLLLLPERYRIACLDQLGLTVRAVVVWSKPNPTPEKGGDRVRRTHEDWVHLTLRPRYYADITPIREPASGYQRHTNASRPAASGQKVRGLADKCNPLGKPPGSVWSVATDPFVAPGHLDVDHDAPFPMEFPRRLIEAWCPGGGAVLDPFGGTGTTALVAHALGRHGISVDMSADYCRLAAWRTSDPAQIAKAMRVEKPPTQMDGQLDLLAMSAAVSSTPAVPGPEASDA
ncbi:DNA-methyltransferase [Lysinibacillus fusiformis]|uniref:DNA-methyltransferase n=1 Tax=Lysinibacillus fusiformis TaxID=28031 RepID=UPI003CFD258F